SLSFLSLKSGEQVKVIKFNNPIVDVLANRKSVVIAFAERIAVFDAFTLEDRLTVTTCYLSPGIYPNPIALGTRWMAYAEKKLINIKKSSGGNEGEGIQSYTATVIHAAKTLGKGLRELGETVASSLTGNSPYKPPNLSGSNVGSTNVPYMSDLVHKGIVTVLDIEKHNSNDGTLDAEGVVAHFVAHSEAIVCMSFDPSGLILFTADKQGHDFHLFRIHPHPGGPALAAVHHLYVLHRGDTTARVQNVSFSPDSRWVAVSTLRGTTHVFPVTPYGGNVGVRTHASPHVVNKMSRFHRSAGLNVEGRSHSPVSLFEAPVNSNLPHHNPRLPPYPHPTVVHPLAQIRQPLLFVQNAANAQHRQHQGRQRLGSCSEDGNTQVALRVCTAFAPPRAWFDNLMQPPDVTLNNKLQIKPVESLFIMSCYGNLLQYDLDPHHLLSIPKEKVCDETPIELGVIAKAQWTLQRQPGHADKLLPLTYENLKLVFRKLASSKEKRPKKPAYEEDQWLSQVEIVTHAGPHRRLWMGPQFTFKTYNNSSGTSFSVNETQAIDLGRSKPVNMPLSATYPVVIESGSASSCEQSPKLFDMHHSSTDSTKMAGDNRLKEDLADAMLESSGVVRDVGGHCVIVSMKPPLPPPQSSSGIVKVVNPLGTVVTLESSNEEDEQVPPINEEAEIHENCDEALFRPIVSHKAVTNVQKSLPVVTKTYSNLKRKDDPVNENTKKKEQVATKIRIDTINVNNERITSPDLELLNVKNKNCNSEPNIKQPQQQRPKKKTKAEDVPEDVENNQKSSEGNDLVILNGIIPQTFTEPKEEVVSNAKKEVKYEFEIKDAPFSSGEEEKGKVEKQEKSNGKKTRKPKPKLGVRLSKLKDNSTFVEEKADNNEKSDYCPDVEVTLTLPKRSWSSVVSMNTVIPQPIVNPLPPLPTALLDLPDIENVQQLVSELPPLDEKITDKYDLIELMNERDDPWSSCNVFQCEKSVDSDSSMLKVYKSSEDENTESSDDSGKNGVDLIGNAIEKKEELQEEEENDKTVQGKSRSSRRKTRNKKK
ncbi:breast carcinoma-amplified sequence 3 homolog, partial [Agrilus planipennis]|uniref:Breast carcinoma-amplified sequence 3 homolog n=1 Tax=Agrilus planipennis TaxID=224129 RepID=A0A1W4XKN8_AGRPL